VGRIGKFGGEAAGALVKNPRPAAGGGPGKSKLTSAHVTDCFRGGRAPEALKKSLQVQLPPFRIFGPMHKGRASAGIIRFPQKSQPQKFRRHRFSRRQLAEHPMHVGGVVKGMSLGEDRPIGQGFVPLGQMMKPGMRLASHVGQGNGVGPSRTGGRGFFVNGHGHLAGHVAGPSQILPAPADHKFQLHGGAEKSGAGGQILDDGDERQEESHHDRSDDQGQ